MWDAKVRLDGSREAEERWEERATHIGGGERQRKRSQKKETKRKKQLEQTTHIRPFSVRRLEEHGPGSWRIVRVGSVEGALSCIISGATVLGVLAVVCFANGDDGVSPVFDERVDLVLSYAVTWDRGGARAHGSESSSGGYA